MARTVKEIVTAIADSIRENSQNTTGSHISKKLSLEEMPNAINEVCDGRYDMGCIETQDANRGKVGRLADRLVDGKYDGLIEIDTVVNDAIADFDNIKNRLNNHGVLVENGTPTSEYDNLLDEVCEKSFQDGLDTRSVEVCEKLSETIEIAQNFGGSPETSEGTVDGQVLYLNTNIPNVYNTGVLMGEGTAREEFDQTMARIDINLEKTVGIANGYLSDGEVPVTPWDKITYLDEKIPEVYEEGKQAGMATSGYSVKIEDGVLIVRNLIDEVSV